MQTNTHVGRVAKLPIYKLVGQNNTPKLILTLAINDLKDNKATFISYTALGQTATRMHDYITAKGQFVEVQFNMRNNNFKDRNTGQMRYEMQNIISNFTLCGSASQHKNTSENISNIDNNLQSSELFGENNSGLETHDSFDEYDFMGE